MKEIIKFLKSHKKDYLEYFEKDRLNKCEYGYTCDINQIYCYLNKIDIKNTEYYTFFKISKKFFDFDGKKILEIGCGKIPILSSIYKMNNYSIEAINNKIIVKNYKKIKTIEYDLTQEIDLIKYDIIIGLRPCTITENIINTCLKYQKDFIIYLCPCIHQPLQNNISFNSYNDWIQYLSNRLNKISDYNIIFESNNELPDNCPIIIGKYQKKDV